MSPQGNPGSLPVTVVSADAVARIAPGATLRQVAEAMVEGDVGALVVGDDAGVSGVVSERDLVRAMAAGQDATTTTAGDIAHTELVRCESDATVAEVATEMMEEYVRHVLIEEDGRLVGIVSARDLLGAYATGAG